MKKKDVPTPGPAERFDAWRVLPAVAFALLPALIVRSRYLAVAPDAAALWDAPFGGDTRSWWKAACVIGIAGWMLAHAAVGLIAGRWPRPGIFASLLAAAALVVAASALLSPFPRTAWLGYTVYYEGGLVLLSYLIAMGYMAAAPFGEAERRLLLRCLGVVVLVNGCLGLFDGLGGDFWRSAIGLRLMGAKPEEITFNFADTGMAYGTVYQPNHYGMLMAMLTAFSVGMLWRETAGKWRIFWGLASMLGTAGVVFSFSRAALIAFAVVMAAFAVALIRRREWRFSPSRRLLTAGAALLVLFLLAGGAGRLRGVFDSMVKRSREWSTRGAREYPVKTVELAGGRITVVLGDGALTLEKTSDREWSARYPIDAEPAALTPAGEKGDWTVYPLPDGNARFACNRKNGEALLTGAGLRLRFATRGREVFALGPGGRLLDTLETAAAASIVGNESLFSGRGYIWSRTIPLIGRHPWLGSGPGTYPLVFPNDDLVAMRRQFSGDMVDKGHGIWATFLVQLGVFGFIVYLLPVAYAVAIGRRRGGRDARPLLMGVCAFLIGSLTNDSTVGVTPIFCLLVGLLAAPFHGKPPPDSDRGARGMKGKR